MYWFILICALVIILIPLLKPLFFQRKKVGSIIALPPKTTIGPDSSIKDLPLLYLYFDDFAEIARAWESGLFEAARDDTDIRSKKFSLNEIMKNKELFIELYKNNLLRLRLNERTDIWYEIGQLYWDDVIHPEKFSSETHSGKQSPAGQAEPDKSVKAIVEKIKIRYGMDKTSTEENAAYLDKNEKMDKIL
ncbi:MAG: hypothetical protein ACYSUK_08870 [Planctomycetota bacterium]|jgi:hypothetical protein